MRYLILDLHWFAIKMSPSNSLYSLRYSTSVKSSTNGRYMLVSRGGGGGGGGGGYSHFFDIRRLGPSIYRSPQKNIRNFKHPKKYLKF